MAEHVIRVWGGTILTSDRDRYVAYVKATGVAVSLDTPGNVGAWVLCRDVDEGYSEVLVISA